MRVLTWNLWWRFGPWEERRKAILTVPFFTTHLTSAIDASATRCRQVGVLAEFVTAHSSGTGFPPVVTGDRPLSRGARSPRPSPWTSR